MASPTERIQSSSKRSAESDPDSGLVRLVPDRACDGGQDDRDHGAQQGNEASLNSDLTDGSVVMPPSAKKRKIPANTIFVKLDEVILNSEEESDLEENYLDYEDLPYLFDSFKGSDDGSDTGPDVSPRLDEGGNEGGALKDTTIKLQGLPSATTTKDTYYTRGSTKPIGTLPTKQAFISFVESYSTCQWNHHFDEVNKFLNVTACIVDPRYFLSISVVQDSEILTMDRIFSRLEKSKCRAWSTFPNALEEFLDFYDYGFEKLSDRLWDSKFAYAELNRFKECMDFARKDTEFTKLQFWYSQFVHHFKDIINIIKTGNIEEAGFHEYVKNLIKMFVDIADLPVNETNKGLRFHLSQGKRKDKGVPVIPDICIYGKETIILVGETKRFGRHGRKHEEHRGSIPKNKGGIPQKSVLQSGKHKLGNVEPIPGPSTGPTDGSDAEEDGSFCPYRRLGRRENYKIRCYLPQLLGQLLCAMQNNGKTLPLGCESENVQLGFGVEGFKLRFVKLVLRDYMGVKISRPTVTGLFDGLPFKCDVFITQEFNLMKKNHLRMFFKMLVAIIFVCEQ